MGWDRFTKLAISTNWNEIQPTLTVRGEGGSKAVWSFFFFEKLRNSAIQHPLHWLCLVCSPIFPGLFVPHILIQSPLQAFQSMWSLLFCKLWETAATEVQLSYFPLTVSLLPPVADPLPSCSSHSLAFIILLYIIYLQHIWSELVRFPKSLVVFTRRSENLTTDQIRTQWGGEDSRRRMSPFMFWFTLSVCCRTPLTHFPISLWQWASKSHSSNSDADFNLEDLILELSFLFIFPSLDKAYILNWLGVRKRQKHVLGISKVSKQRWHLHPHWTHLQGKTNKAIYRCRVLWKIVSLCGNREGGTSSEEIYNFCTSIGKEVFKSVL